MDPKVLRQHARDCARLAEECVDFFTREALRELATQFWRVAEAEVTLRRQRRWNPLSNRRRLPSRTSRKPVHRVAQTRRRASQAQRRM